MADIKQAAIWMEQGKSVTRGDGYVLCAIDQGEGNFSVSCFYEDSVEELFHTVFTDDILAYDWEITD